ncbi:MAG: hypothetical protein WCP32_16500 [Bacteroidota bacterium]
MNQRLRIYLDTSVPNFLFADDSPEKMEITLDLFINFIKPSIYRSFISPVVIAEIEETKDDNKRIQLLNWELGYRHELRIITPLELMDYGI